MNFLKHHKTKLLAIALIALSLFIFLFQLGKEVFIDYDEATYANVIRTTNASSDKATLKSSPTNTWFEKPPLYFWAAMAADHLPFSKEFSYRLPSALLGVLCIILISLIIFEIEASWVIALIGGFILLTTGAFLEAGRQVRMDVPVTAALLFALYSFIKGQKKNWWLAGVGLGMSIAIMLKSIIGFFVIPLILIWAIVFKQYAWIKNIYFWLGCVLMVIIVVPWHVYESLRYGKAFWDSYFSYHILERFNENILGNQATNSSYLKYLITLAFPWTTAFLIGLVGLFSTYRKENILDRALLASGLIVVFISGVFFYAHSKLIYYFIPIYPFVALFLALYIAKIYRSQSSPINRKKVGVWVTVLCVVALPYALYIGYHFQQEGYANQFIAREEATAGRIIAQATTTPLIYMYEYPYRETLRYYSNGAEFQNLSGGQLLDKPAYLVVYKKFTMQAKFAPELEKRLEKKFDGEFLVLFQYTP